MKSPAFYMSYGLRDFIPFYTFLSLSIAPLYLQRCFALQGNSMIHKNNDNRFLKILVGLLLLGWIVLIVGILYIQFG